MISFKIDFLLILDGFWEGLGGQVGPKIHQKSMKNQWKINQKMHRWQDGSWDGF